MLREDFLQNLKAIEKGLLESQCLEHMNSHGFSKSELTPIYAKILELAVQGALNLEELEIKQKSASMELEKVRCDMELSTLNAKAQIKIAQAAALKELIQSASMIRSVADNAIINQANAGVGFLNVLGNCTDVGRITSYAAGFNKIILSINTQPMTTFDDALKNLIDKSDDNFGSKDVIIHSSKKLLSVGEFVELVGISTYGHNKTKWLINDVVVASNTKNYIFEAKEVGEYKIRYEVKDDKDESIRDELLIKVVEGELNKEKTFMKKF